MRLLVLVLLILSCPLISDADSDCSNKWVGDTFVVSSHRRSSSPIPFPAVHLVPREKVFSEKMKRAGW